MPPFKIAIVGAGIAGLATAVSLSQKTDHDITVIEGGSDLTEPGAGIQIAPNASRLLKKWGMERQFEDIAMAATFMQTRTYNDDEVLGRIPTNAKGYASQVWGAPHWLVHRLDYQKILAEAAAAGGAKILLDRKVTQVRDKDGEICFQDGTTMTADIIIGADGIHSRVRQSLLDCHHPGHGLQPVRAVNYCYRALIPRAQMLTNELTAELIDHPEQMIWAGPSKHIFAYPISKGQLYNLVMFIPDDSDAPLGAYNAPADPAELRKEFEGWNQTVIALASLVDNCTKWRIADLPALPTWSSPNGRCVLIGDAAHAMTPHAGSGSSTALEDAEVYGIFLAACKNLDDLPKAAAAYQTLRKARCERIQQISRENAVVFSIPPGPAQEARDAKLRESKAMLEKYFDNHTEFPKVPPDMNMPFPHPAILMWLYGHDAAEEAQKHCESF